MCIYCVSSFIASISMRSRSHKIRIPSSSRTPITVACYFDVVKIGQHNSITDINADKATVSIPSRITRVRKLPIYDEDKYPSKRQMEEWTEKQTLSQAQLRDSRKYRSNTPENEHEHSTDANANYNADADCQIRHTWQSEHQYHPICNSVHQNDLTRFYVESNTGVGENLRLIASGYWRDVWKVPEREEGRQWVAVKTLRYKHAYSNRNFDRHRRDAVATERVSSSPYTVDIYAHCGHTMYSEFSTGGSLSDLIWPKEENTKRKKNSRNDGEKSSSALSMKERLALAIKAVRGLVAFQFPDDPKKASMSHTDITPSQFILVDGTLKLNDFNRARFIPFKEDGSACPFHVTKNPGKFRSPEEYGYEDETEKIDVYSMGNVLYSLLTGSWPFEEFETEEAQEKVLNGERPSIDRSSIIDPYALVLINTIEKCWTHKATERPSSQEILGYLEKEAGRLNVVFE